MSPGAIPQPTAVPRAVLPGSGHARPPPRRPDWRRRVLDRLRRILFAFPGLRLIVRAVQGYIRHQCASQAGSVAFSSLV